ncbi:MAG: hypothetical protein J0L50_12090 [Sphingomonadales bacterium]|nr:hypothetical protein [Sphingomonadales bacterium]
MIHRAILLALLTVPLVAAAPAKGPATRPLTCAVPVQKGDTAASLKKRYGTQARAMKIHAAEGEMVDGMALWPNDPARRIDVFFSENPGKRVETIRITGDKSRWRIGGLGIGSNLDAVLKANGRPVRVGGFGWDYGGGVDPRGGKLAKWPGGCRIGLVMDVGPDVANPPDNVMGDGVSMGSSSQALRAARPVVTKVFISWP